MPVPDSIIQAARKAKCIVDTTDKCSRRRENKHPVCAVTAAFAALRDTDLGGSEDEWEEGFNAAIAHLTNMGES